MKVVEFAPHYQKAVVALILAVQNDEFGLGLSLDEQPDLINIFDSYNAAGGMFWVALGDEGDIVGTIGVVNLGGGIGVLKKFFVRPDYRTRKVGLALYQALETFCEKAGFTTLILDTPSIAHDSHRFYERNGFRRIAAEELPVSYTYPDRDSLLYLKRL
ncbi:MAG: GNAT family N-acetyltransferase [Adlercreutzia sp.]|nr:GNAT family N-acetyltransferase [Adlercreutzia sp.]